MQRCCIITVGAELELLVHTVQLQVKAEPSKSNICGYKFSLSSRKSERVVRGHVSGYIPYSRSVTVWRWEKGMAKVWHS